MSHPLFSVSHVVEAVRENTHTDKAAGRGSRKVTIGDYRFTGIRLGYEG